MKILVDANIFTRKQKTGVDYYTLGLVLAAARAMPKDHFILAHFGAGEISIPDDIHNIRIKRIWWLPGRMYGLYRHYLKSLPFELLVPVRANAMFFPDFSCPPTLQNVPKLVVIHDLVYLLQPEYVPAGHRKFLSSIVSQALKQATCVVVNSISTQQDIEQEYRYDGTKISVIPPAVDHVQYQPANGNQISAVKKKYGIKGDYLLFLSTLEPRKNVVGIIKAYQQLTTELKETHQLVLAGKKGWLDEEIEQLCEAMGERVLRTGRIDAQDQAALYSGATLFALPSFYEGFGMPILEAMACGAPVITSNTSSMPEVAGNAALLVNPNSTDEIAQAFTKILTNPTLARELVDHGKKQAKQYNWARSGQQLANLVRSLVKN